MANRTKGIWKDGGGAGKAERSSGPLRRFLVFFLALAAVLGVVMAAAYRDGTGFDVLRRYLNYGGSASSGEERYRYDFSPGNRFAVLGDQLVVLSENSLRLLNRDGGGDLVRPGEDVRPGSESGRRPGGGLRYRRQVAVCSG